MLASRACGSVGAASRLRRLHALRPPPALRYAMRSSVASARESSPTIALLVHRRGSGRRAPGSRASPRRPSRSPSRCSSSSPISAKTSALAPTSIPRVGSSRSSTRGLRVRQRAITTFCWLPPDRLRIEASIPAVRMLQPVDRLPADLTLPPRLGRPERPGAHGDVLTDAPGRCSAPAGAGSSGTSAMPLLERRPRRAGAHLAAADEHAAAVRAAHAEDRLEQLRPARAHEAGEPDHLAGVHLNETGSPVPGATSDSSPRAPARRGRPGACGSSRRARGRPSSTLSFSSVSSVARQPADVPAVAQDDRPVGELDDLGQPVRDQDRRGAVVAQPAQQPEESLDVALAEPARRLVEDQDARVASRAPCPPRRARGRPPSATSTKRAPGSTSTSISLEDRPGQVVVAATPERRRAPSAAG